MFVRGSARCCFLLPTSRNLFRQTIRGEMNQTALICVDLLQCGPLYVYSKCMNTHRERERERDIYIYVRIHTHTPMFIGNDTLAKLF